jgi:hypothetical protein
MHRTDRVVVILLFVCGSALALACGAPGGPTPLACTGDEGCGPTARCNGTACVENQPPTAQFSVSGELVASSEVVLDGSASHDPDGGDTISAYNWSVSSTDAACEPPAIASTSRSVTVRFGCGGHWAVKLVVFDGKQAGSAAAIQTLEVTERPGPGVVTASADQAVAHVCAGATPTCTTASSVQLGATLHSEASLTVRWSVQPPAGLPLGTTRRVTFDPDATALAPKAVIETDGTAISGDWVFRVEALNGTEVLGYAVTRVSVGNQKPTITGRVATGYPHTYSAQGQVFSVAGSIPVTISDPDGDPVLATATGHHTGDGTSAFLATYTGGSLSFSLMVPVTNPLWLIGGADLSRTIRLEATDVNGGAATPTDFPILVTNSPPRRIASSSSVQHSFDVVNQEYVATPGLGYWSDPDGDPLDHQVTMTDAAAADCPTTSLMSDGSIRANCAKRWTSTGDLAAFIAPRTAQVVVADPWQSLEAISVPFRISNRSPTTTTASPTTSPWVSCTTQGGVGYCPGGGSGTPPHNNVYATLSTRYSVTTVTDPDGDPIQVTPSASGLVATGSSCSGTQRCIISYTLPSTEYCASSPPPTTIPFTATDGAAPLSVSLTVTPSCN